MHATTLLTVTSAFSLATLASAGNVTVQVKDHSLRATAKDPCALVVDQAGLPFGSIRVTPISNGGVTTTLNGSNTPIVFTGIDKDVRCEFDDEVNLKISNVNVGRDLTIDLEHLAEIEILDCTIQRDLKVTCDDDGLFLILDDCAIDDDLTIDIDEGRSALTLRDNIVEDDTSIDLGKPQDSAPNVVTLDGGTFGDKLTIEGSSSGGDIVASGGNAPVVFGKTDVKLGDGDNSFELFGATLIGKTSYRGGKNEDFVSLVNCGFESNVTLDMRDGTNTTSISQSVFVFDLKIVGDDDFDTVGMSSVEVRDDLTIDVDDGNDMLQLTNVKVSDDLRIDTGKDNDTLTQTNVVVLGESDID